MALIARSPKQLGNIIQRTRKHKALTQTQLAGLTGLRQELISRIESGHEGAKLSAIYDLFAALDLDLIVGARSDTKSVAIEDIF